MDFLRATTKALYADFPLNATSFFFSEKDPVSQKDTNLYVKKILVEILQRTEPTFTSSNIESLMDVVFDEWLSGDSFQIEDKTSIEDRFHLILSLIGHKFLGLSGKFPVVCFEHLLRWRNLTFNISEDLVTIPAVALYDHQSGISIEERNFLWPDTLSHDADWVNDILNTGLSDIHSHLLSSSDTSVFNWNFMMNNPAEINRLESQFTQLIKEIPSFCYKTYDPILPSTGSGQLRLSSWIHIAAYIRSELFRRLNGICDANEDWIIDLVYIDSVKSKQIIEHIADSVKSLFNLPESDYQVVDTSCGVKWDYAIINKFKAQIGEHDLSSPYMIHYGERRLLYEFFRGLFKGEKTYINLSKYVWLYLLIKNKFRREVIAINNLTGYKNFQSYYAWRNISHRQADGYGRISMKYAVQTSIGDKKKHFLETRAGINVIKKFPDFDFNISIFGKQTLFDKSTENLTLVTDFMKNEKYMREPLSIQVSENHKEKRKIIRYLSSLSAGTTETRPRLVAVDACSNELAARPYAFAECYHEIALQSMTNHTFHVAEDFHDVIDGLRAIDEAICCLHSSNVKLRLGHALALGIDIETYYGRRHSSAILPRQVLLDNIVWLRFKAEYLHIAIDESILTHCESIYKEQYRDIGYDSQKDLKDTPMDIYWQSYLLRLKTSFHLIDKRAIEVYNLFEKDELINQRGNKAIEIVIDNCLISLIKEIQSRMLKDVEERRICIECNPSSNLVIGPFDRYREHPIFIFNDPNVWPNENKIPVAICTDTKGILATSIENEYSLIAAAMLKGIPHGRVLDPYSKEVIKRYLKEIQDNGKKYRFRV